MLNYRYFLDVDLQVDSPSLRILIFMGFPFCFAFIDYVDICFLCKK